MPKALAAKPKNIHILYWMEKYLKIINVDGELVPLSVNIAQQKVHNTLNLQYNKGLPMRVIVLKARREGVCLSPRTKILTTDLKWVALSNIKIGQKVVSVDETPQRKGSGYTRAMKTAVVEAKNVVKQKAYRLEMDDGRVLIATKEHKFLSRKRGGTETVWRKVGETRVGDKIRFIVRPWGKADFDDAWFGGLLDGEGTLRKKNRAGSELTFCQTKGAVLDKAIEYVKRNGYSFRLDWDFHKRRKDNYNRKPLGRIVCGKFGDIFEIIGKTRPVRFLDRNFWESKKLPTGGRDDVVWGEVVSITPLDVRKMIDLQTSTKTFIAEGYVSHNSTYFEGRFFAEINHRPNRYACIASADTDSSDKVFKMSKLFQEQMPVDMKRPTDYSNRKEIVYSAPHRSEFRVQTAGKDILGRGGLTHYFHFSEVAFWENAKEKLGGASQEVPDKPNTIIALESTAAGLGGAFYDMFWQAVKDWKITKNPANYLPIFLPWFIFPDYQMKIPEGVRFEIGNVTASNIPAEWVEDERELVAKYNLCNEQLFWRRWAIKNKCQSDLDLFHAEYPATAREAFVATGRQVFNQPAIDRLEKNCKAGSFVLLEPGGDKIRAETVLQRKQCWQIWQMPKQGHEYTIGVDAMEGKQADPNDPKSKFDYHGASVFCRNSGEFVAEWHGQGSQKDLGYQCLYAAQLYNDAWIAPELPTGMVVLDVLKEKGYDRIYQRQKGDERLDEYDSDNLGWRTTIITRPKMIENFRDAVLEGSLKASSFSLIEEMRSFTYDKEGRARHLPGEHDDLLFSAMIALQLHLRLPMKSAPYPYATTFAATEPIKKKTNIAMHGAVDTWESPEDDFLEDEEYTD